MSNTINCQRGTHVIKDGSTKRYHHNRTEKCKDCDGAGKIRNYDYPRDDDYKTCPTCKGAKLVKLELDINIFPA